MTNSLSIRNPKSKIRNRIMVVERIQKIQQQRAFFTGVYGQLHDLFVENSLQRYNFNQQLYRYLKQEQFGRVVFFDLDKGFFSYDTESLVQLINTDLARQQNPANPTPPPNVAPHHEQDRRAQGSRRLLGRKAAPADAPAPVSAVAPNAAAATPAPSSGLIKSMDTGRSQSYQWNVPRTSVIFDKIKEFLTNTQNKGALIFIASGHTDMATFTGQLISVFRALESNALLIGNQNRVFIYYEGKTAADFRAHFGGGLFSDTFFRSRFFKSEGGDQLELNQDTTFEVSAPTENEIRNALNRRRFHEKIHWHWASFDKLVKSIYRDGHLCESIMKLPQAALDKLYQVDAQSAWERLQGMIGLERVKKEVEKELILARSPKRLTDRRRHLVFTGNPGTGKTTVARLVAEIYKENNILSRGHLVEGDRETLVAGYLGQSAIKTKAICEKALGGVLFIDEAYNLKKGEGSDEFGEEAINTLLKSMEDNKDTSMVIVAGYTKEMDTFFKANPGLRSRFGDNFIEFEDYTPPQLMEIFKKKATKAQLNVEIMLPSVTQIVQKWYEQRDQNFGNARTVETLVEGIVKNHTYRCGLENLDVFRTPVIREDIPVSYLAHLSNDKTNTELETAMQSLNAMIGLKNVKETIRAYATRIKAQQTRNKKLGTNAKIELNLGFVFTGHPGTGKTTVARLLGQILKGLGLLSSDKVFEVNRDALVAGFVGQTALKTRQVIEAAKGAVLFIDEAYSLANKGTNDFGHEAIETLLAAMTDPRYQGKMAFVVAGYPEDMKTFIESNSGLQRRFDKYVDFENYTSAELVQIFEFKVKKEGFLLGAGYQQKAFRFFESIPRNRFFGNAGEAEKLVGIATTQLDIRMEEQGLEDLPAIITILAEDIPTIESTRYLPTPYDNRSAKTVEPIVEPTKPVEIVEKPVEVAENPVEIVENPVEITENPVEIVENPVDAKYEALIRPFMYDICLIDTNIWLETRPTVKTANMMAIKTISKIYQEKQRQMTILDSCFDELEKKSSMKSIDNPEIRTAARDAVKVIEKLQKLGTIDIPDVKAYFRTKDTYADDKLFDYAEAQAKTGKSVLFISQDRKLRMRIIGAIKNVQKNKPEIEFSVLEASEMCAATIEISKYWKEQKKNNDE
jgi:SpoVK/Ycf46/Vps4 family AAA+-type ATPase